MKASAKYTCRADGWSVNARCLDAPEALIIDVEPFDGRNWEQHAAALAHLSHEPSAREDALQ